MTKRASQKKQANEPENPRDQLIDRLNERIVELTQQNKDYTEIVQHATEVIFKLDREGNFCFVSAEFERMLQFSNAEMQGRHFTTIIHPDDVQICLENMVMLQQMGRAPNAIDFRVQIKTGGYRWVSCSAICRYDENGNPSHFIGMAHEVTQLHELLAELKASQQALAVNEEQYRSLFDALSEGAVLVDAAGTIRAANRSAERIFGASKKDILTVDTFRKQFDFIHEDGSPFPAEKRPATITLLTGQPIKGVIMGIVKGDDPVKWISLNTEPIYYGADSTKPDAVITSFTDITQAKADREALQRNQQLLALENQRYVEATRALAQAVVDAQEKERADIGFELHDNVNQILTTVRLYLDLACLNEKDRLDLIRKSANGVTSAVSEIRKICHSLVPSSLNDVGLVASIEDLLEAVGLAGKIHTEFFHCGDTDHIPEKSRLVLFRIIQEQVTNVLKHAEATNLSVELIVDEGTISLSISDNGKGFDNVAGRSRKGVGLHNISNRVQLLNGKVNMITSPGSGCKLNILIPI